MGAHPGGEERFPRADHHRQDNELELVDEVEQRRRQAGPAQGEGALDLVLQTADHRCRAPAANQLDTGWDALQRIGEHETRRVDIGTCEFRLDVG